MRNRCFFFSLLLKTFSSVPLVFVLCFTFCTIGLLAQQSVQVNADGQLSYLVDEKGNRVPDFSYAGYKASESELPHVAAAITVLEQQGDATARIQQAIDYVSSLKPDKSGFRGAVQLGPGRFEVEGSLILHSSGVVLRGSGMEEGGTLIIATGTDRRTLIQIRGADEAQEGFASEVQDAYVPVNSTRLRVADPSGFAVGQSVRVHRPSVAEWIRLLEAEAFGGRETAFIGWKPGQRDLYWERRISALQGDTITLDVPITTALDSAFGGGRVTVYSNKGRVTQVGVENMLLQSHYDTANLKDEAHSFNAIDMTHAQDAWVRAVSFKHFAGSAVAVWESSRRVTVEDCVSKAPVSEIGNWRRFTFYTQGQQTLFRRLYSEYGYHDFAVGFCAAGPNVFVECEAYKPYNFSGTIDSWASGVLFDIVNVDGEALSLTNRWLDHQGAGWTAASSVLWQSSASRILNFSPPGAQNWAIGCWGQFTGNGVWEAQNNHVRPRSLFHAQLAERLGKNPEEFLDAVRPVPGFASTSPTLEQAAQLTGEALEPHVSLEVWIRSRVREQGLDDRPGPRVAERKLKMFASEQEATELPDFSIENGWLTANGALIVGGRHHVPWWRGVARPYEVAKAQPAVTRFVPGRTGKGYTDDLPEVVAWMKEAHLAVLEHNYGLWYERRRDDHQRTRRSDGDVWAPFYEQPFARSGEGLAWDGLSKYDLTRFNPFYWERLSNFARLAAAEGKLLFHNHFFQHNILEAGAHWADSPWRPVNNLNQTNFPEPVKYAGDKRIFLADQFYDISNEVHRSLYRNYIRQGLSAFEEDLPVMHLVSAEYTGPFHFVAFWLEVIAEWEQETGRSAWVVLSTTKDVQDAVLAQSDLASVVDVIDIRYWAQKADGSLYAPEGGQHLAPRQHARINASGKRNFESVYQSVLPYRLNHPDKVLVYSEGRYDQFGWAVLFAGGSLPVLPVDLPEDFLKETTAFFPDPGHSVAGEYYSMRNKEGEWLVYSVNGALPSFRQGTAGVWEALILDARTGALKQEKQRVDDLSKWSTCDAASVVWIRR